jgi:hypothetical protein
VKITSADDRDVDDNTVDYKLVPFRLGMHFEDMPLPEFNDIVFIRRRPQHETTIKDIAALAFAASRNYVESMRTMLFDTRIDPNSLDYDGRTALYVAVNNEQVEAIQLLLEAGADPYIVDSSGQTPIDRARELERDDIVEMLMAGSTGAPPAQLKETELRVVDMHEREASARTVKSAVATRKGFSERLDKELLDPDFRVAPAPAPPVEAAEDDQFTVGGLVKTNWSVAASRMMTPGGRRLPPVNDDPDALALPSSISRPASDGPGPHAFNPFEAHRNTLHARTESVRPGETKRVNASDGVGARPRINSLGPGMRAHSTHNGLVDVIDSGEVSASQVSARLHNNTPSNARSGLARTALPTIPLTPHLHTSPTISPRGGAAAVGLPAVDRSALLLSTRSKSTREHVRTRDHADTSGAAAPLKASSGLARGTSERGALTFARTGRSNGSHSAREDRSSATMAGAVSSIAESPQEQESNEEANSDDEIEMAVIVRSPRPEVAAAGPRGRKGTAGQKGRQMASVGEYEIDKDDNDSDSDSSQIDSGIFRDTTQRGAHPIGVYDVDNGGDDKPVKRISMIGVKAAHGHRAGVPGEEQLGVSTVKRLHLTERRISTKTPKKKKKKDAVAAVAPSKLAISDELTAPSPTMGSTAAVHVDPAAATTAAAASSGAGATTSGTMAAGESPPTRVRMHSVRSVGDLLALDGGAATPARGSLAVDDDDAVTVRRFPAVRTGGGNSASTVKPQTEVMSSAAAAAVALAAAASAAAPTGSTVAGTATPAPAAASTVGESPLPATPDPSFFKKLLGRSRAPESDDESSPPTKATTGAAKTTEGVNGGDQSTKPAATTTAAPAAAAAVPLVSPRTVKFADKPIVFMATDSEDSRTSSLPSVAPAAPVATPAATPAATTATPSAAAAPPPVSGKSTRRRKKKPHVVVTPPGDDDNERARKSPKAHDDESADSDDHVHNMTRRNKRKLETLRRNQMVSMPGTVSDAESSHERRQSTGTKLGEGDDQARDDSRSGSGGNVDGSHVIDGERESDHEDDDRAGDDSRSAVPQQARLEPEKLGFFDRAVRRLQAHNMVTNLEAAFIESYRGLVLLRNFGELNKQAIDKILKKHDKQLGTHFRESWQAQNCYQLTFCEQSMLGDLMREMELLYAQAYTRGHRTDAMNRLRVPDEGEHDVEVPAFQFGITLGLTLTLLAIAIYIFGLMEEKPPFYTEMFIMFRGFFMAIVLVWYWGLNMYLWERYRVNYAFIFEFNAREHTKHITMWRAASIFSLVWALFFLVWAISVAKPAGFAWLGALPPFALPLSMLIVFVLAFVVYSFRSSHWLIRTIARIISTPFRRVLFRDFYVGDQLISLAITLMDFEFIACFYVSDVGPDFNSSRGECLAINIWIRPLIAALPAYWRFVQSLRRYRDGRDLWQVANAGKYATSLVVTMFSILRALYADVPAFQTLWIVALTASAMFGYYWDMYRDFGFFHFDAEKNRRVFYPHDPVYPMWCYYATAVANLIMRVMWAFTVSPSTQEILGLDALWFATVIAFFEIMRRAMWNMHRVAHEQTSNCGGFRAIAFVPIPIANTTRKPMPGVLDD